jgi:hypothetical protein
MCVDRGHAGNGLKQQPVQVGSTNRDRAIKPAAQIRHPGGQQPPACNTMGPWGAPSCWTARGTASITTAAATPPVSCSSMAGSRGSGRDRRAADALTLGPLSNFGLEGVDATQGVSDDRNVFDLWRTSTRDWASPGSGRRRIRLGGRCGNRRCRPLRCDLLGFARPHLWLRRLLHRPTCRPCGGPGEILTGLDVRAFVPFGPRQ